MSNPSVLFDIAKHNPIVTYYVKYWMGGNIKFEEMLINCYSNLEQRCVNLISEYDLDYKLPNARPALWLINDLDRQYSIINCIHLIDKVHDYLLTLIQSKLEKRIPVVMQNTVTGEVTFSYKDELDDCN